MGIKSILDKYRKFIVNPLVKRVVNVNDDVVARDVDDNVIHGKVACPECAQKHEGVSHHV